MTIKQTALGYRMTGDDLAALGMALAQVRQAEAIITRLLAPTGIPGALTRPVFSEDEQAELGLASVGGDGRGDVIG